MADREQDFHVPSGEAAGSRQQAEAVAGPQAEVSGEDAEFQRAMAVGRKVMDDHRAVLAALAK